TTILFIGTVSTIRNKIAALRREVAGTVLARQPLWFTQVWGNSDSRGAFSWQMKWMLTGRLPAAVGECDVVESGSRKLHKAFQNSFNHHLQGRRGLSKKVFVSKVQFGLLPKVDGGGRQLAHVEHPTVPVASPPVHVERDSLTRDVVPEPNL
ncbi:unnamed protein product, partial [Ixodes hexagonus]